MKAIKGIFKEGKLELAEPAPEAGPVEVLVVFPDSETDPWQPILNETSLRPAFAKYVEEALEEIAQGKH